MRDVNPARFLRFGREIGAKKRPGGVDRALGNRPMGDWTASELSYVPYATPTSGLSCNDRNGHVKDEFLITPSQLYHRGGQK